MKDKYNVRRSLEICRSLLNVEGAEAPGDRAIKAPEIVVRHARWVVDKALGVLEQVADDGELRVAGLAEVGNDPLVFVLGLMFATGMITLDEANKIVAGQEPELETLPSVRAAEPAEVTS